MQEIKKNSFRFVATLIGIALLAGSLAAPAQEPTTAQNEEIRQLRELVRQQGEALRRIQAELEAQKETVRAVADSQQQVEEQTAALAQTKDVKPLISLGKGIEQLKLTGDLRTRFEYDERDNNGTEQNRSRFRPRLRLGAIWQGTENWELGVGLATGDERATSTNDTWGDTNAFKTGEIRLDYAYAKHRWDDLSLTIGQQKNPFVGTWVIWDSDVRPTGATLQYQPEGWFATVGGYDVRHYGRDEGNAMLGAVQAGLDGKQGAFGYKAAVAWYYYNHATVDPNSTGRQPSPAIADEDYTFNLGSVYAEAAYKTDNWKGTLFGEYTRNFSAEGATSQVGGGVDPEDNDTAWIAGASVGYRKLTIGYAYAHIEADSVYGQVNDSTFGGPIGTTDVKGHKVGLGYALTSNLNLGATAYFTDPLERSNPKNGLLYNLDLVWKF
jgi:hypothetical protein